ncbi:MAG: helix-turn-helix domain-containing protein [Gammaproteobacteria bacterium]|nr:helix-turn-helix domain-containing protein [Gammaproteobacteria bacterium]NNC96776.1 helix-turn-helix domain-containing protein [Gammaproteobacteria bacterium]NNM14967.1 helix-turn-helix domain-containing protein [Gammaproteobacteria bacterium]
MKSIGERMAYARKEKKLNQKDLATHLGVTRGSISQYENGIIEPSLENLDRTARFLDVSFEWLAFGRGLQDRSANTGNYEVLAKNDHRLVYLTDSERELVENYQKLSKKLQTSVSNIVEQMDSARKNSKK